MHELSIAISLVEIASEEAARHGARARAVHLKWGPLSGVVAEALQFSYEVACEGSPLAGSRLILERIPITAWCDTCQKIQAIASMQNLCCPDCNKPTPDIRTGRELEMTGLEIEDDPPTRLVEVRQQVLKHNDVVARALRQRFQDAGVIVVSIVSSPGSGKTAFLQEILTRLGKTSRVAALVGDLETDNDARRLARSGAPVRQIVTGTVCHLDAQMIQTALADAAWNLEELDYLFIENVGNLVCPASYDLGERLRLVLFSVTEGEDKPLKYPTIFNTADVAVITKLDLAEAVEFDAAAARSNIHTVRPGMRIEELSTKTGRGFDGVVRLFQEARASG